MVILELHKMNCNCCFDSQVCYIKYLNNTSNNDKIYLSEYIKNKIKYDTAISNSEIQLICKNGNKIKCIYGSNYKKDHFSHIMNNGSYSDMSKWHTDWQDQFKENKEIYINKRRADVAINNNVIEFQHSTINKKTVDCRKAHYECENYILNWILDGCANNVDVFNIKEKTIDIKFKHSWMFASFYSYKKIYVDYNNNLYSYNPNHVKNNMITCILYMKNTDFINDVKDDTLQCDDDIFTHQCNLYVNQRGAGSGKTYESIQLLEMEEFEHKDIFIYVTKQHSAKSVIYDELIEQIKDKRIMLDCEHEILTEKTDKKQVINIKKNNSIKKIVIGTIDSLIYSFNREIEKNNKYDLTKGLSSNMFINILVNMINFYGDDGIDVNIKNIKYPENILLNKKTMIIIDEAQDLETYYIESLKNIMKNTYFDVYIIGDALQSLQIEHNIMTSFNDNIINDNIILLHLDVPNKNKTLRFHNKQFIKFVNSVINFKKYKLCQITDICDITCKYNHEDTVIPYSVHWHNVYTSDKEMCVQYKIIIDTYIIPVINKHIMLYNYTPYNFLFVFPILKNNYFISVLETEMQDYWVKKFDDMSYVENIKKNNDDGGKYWCKYNETQNIYDNFIYKHQSQDGQPINMAEYKYASKILSIHASKGLGKEVVFLMGLSDKSLKLCSITENLIYESLLHVSVTRQKKNLHVHLMSTYKDSLYNRFKEFNIVDVFYNNEISLTHFNPVIKISDLKKTLIQNSDDIIILIKYINEYYINDNIPNNDDNTKQLIDYNHYIIKYYMLYYCFLYKISTITTSDTTIAHVYMTLTKFKEKELKPCSRKTYQQDCLRYRKCNCERGSDKPRCDCDVKKLIPILQYDSNDLIYESYYILINKTFNNIKLKIKKSKYGTLPIFCPVEIIVLYHLFYLHKSSVLSNIVTISDVYNIIHMYKQNFHLEAYNHSECECECICHKIFLNNDNSVIDCDVTAYYSNIYHINTICDNFNKKINLNDLQININLKVESTENENIMLCTNFDMIANNTHDIYVFYISPQYNKMNCDEIIIECILNTYLINNVGIRSNKYYDNKNIIKFSKKNIHHVILTLDSDEPIFINLKNIDNININHIIYKHCLYIYNGYNDGIILLLKIFFNKNIEKNNNINSDDCFYDALNDTISEFCKQKGDKLSRIPIYLKECMVRVLDEINDDNRLNIKQYYDDDFYKIKDILAKKISRILKKYFDIQ